MTVRVGVHVPIARRREDAPLVAAYDGLVAAGGHGLAHGRSRSSASSSRLAWKPVHSRSTMPSLRKESASTCHVWLAGGEAAQHVAEAVGAVDPAAGRLDAAEELGVDEAAYGPEAAHAAHHLAVGHDRAAGDEAVEDLGRVVAAGGDPELGEVDELAGHPDHVGTAVAAGEEQVDDRVRAVPVVVVDLEEHVAGRRLVGVVEDVAEERVLAARDEHDVAAGQGVADLRLVGLPAVGGEHELEVGVALAGELAEREVELVRAHRREQDADLRSRHVAHPGAGGQAARARRRWSARGARRASW